MNIFAQFFGGGAGGGDPFAGMFDHGGGTTFFMNGNGMDDMHGWVWFSVCLCFFFVFVCPRLLKLRLSSISLLIIRLSGSDSLAEVDMGEEQVFYFKNMKPRKYYGV